MHAAGYFHIAGALNKTAAISNAHVNISALGLSVAMKSTSFCMLATRNNPLIVYSVMFLLAILLTFPTLKDN